MKIDEVVPLLDVKDIDHSLKFYVDELGFEIKNKWAPQGKIKWCMLGLQKVHFMIQQFDSDGPNSKHFKENKGEGVRFCIFCDNAIEMYHRLLSKNMKIEEPSVSNGLWVVSVTDPDGYSIDFESPTKEKEDKTYSDVYGQGSK